MEISNTKIYIVGMSCMNPLRTSKCMGFSLYIKDFRDQDGNISIDPYKN